MILQGMLFWQSLSLRAESRQLAGSGPGQSPGRRAAVEFPTRGISRTCGLIALGLGVAVLLGWVIDSPALKTVLPGLIAMQPWAAITIALAGGALFFATARGRVAAATCIALASAILIIGLQTLLQYATGLDLGTDRLLFPTVVSNQPGHPHPGRVAEVTSIAFAMLGTMFLLAHVERAWARGVFSTIGTAGLLLMAAPLLGYLIGAGILQSVALFTPISLHAALGLVVLFLGVLALRWDTGWMAVLSGDTPGATSARMLLPVSVAGPILLAWLFTSGKEAELYGPEFQIGLITLATIALLATSLVWSAARLDRLHRARLAAAEALRESEEQLRVAIEAADLGVWDLDLKTDTASNRSLRHDQMFGYAELQPEWHRAICERHMLDEDKPHFREAFARALETGVLTVEVRVCWPDGSVHWISTRGQTYYDEHSEPIRIIGVVADVTERRQAEEAVRQSRKVLETVVDHIPVAVNLIRGSDLRLQLVNPAYQAIAPGKPMVGKTLDELWPETGQDFAALCRRVLETGEPHHVEDQLNLIRRRGNESLEPAYFSWSLHRVSLPGEQGWGLLNTAWETTERKRTEEKLAEQLGLFTAITGSAADAIFVSDGDQRVTFMNPAAERIFGWSRDELRGRKLHEAIHNRYLDGRPYPEPECPHTRVYATGETLLSHEDVFFHKDGSPVPVACSNAPLMIEGRIAGAVLVAHDITSRKRVEEALRESEVRLRTLTEAIPQLLWTCAADGSCTYLSPQWCRYTGASKAEHIGYAWINAVHPDDRLRLLGDWERSVRSRQIFDTEVRIRGAEGGYRWFKQRAVPLIVPDGTVEQWFGTSTDITDMVNARQELVNSEARYRILFEQAAVGIQQLSLDGRILRVNAKLCEMLGYAPDELVGRSFRDITLPEDLEQDEHLLGLLLKNEIPSYAHEERYLRKDGTPLWVWVESSIAGEGRLDDPYRISVVVDISGRKQAEDALFQEKERAEVTLQCIGDAVITTDPTNTITYLNPVAERLTGWSLEEAKGQALPAVFQIFDEETRIPAPDPVQRCLREGHVSGLNDHTVLISCFGEERAIAESAAPIHDRNGDVLGAVLVFHDISRTRRLARQLQHDAAHDSLTGLVNRREFERRLDRAVASARQHGLEHALCYFDLDHFKLVNDTAGHAAGDALLKQVKGLLAGKFRERDTLARLGGDEFALLLDNCRLDEACRIAEVIVATFREWRFSWQDRTFQVGISAGVAAVTRECESGGQHLLAQADVACYTAKNHGRNRVYVYRRDGAKPPPHHARMLLAATLNDALKNNRFRLFGQAIVSLGADGGRPLRNEVLLRLLDDSGAMLLPDTFIPAAERYGMMACIDRWVIENALRTFAVSRGATNGSEMSLNLSGDSLSTDDLSEFVLHAFEENDIRPEAICFEITETAAIDNLDHALKFIREVRGLGCRIALDDFGSGLSSFQYLRNLPADYLKIDGSFVRNISHNEQDEAVVAAINEVGHTLGIATIAEYVHDLPTAERLRRIGVDYAQGYAFGAPTPLEHAIFADGA